MNRLEREMRKTLDEAEETLLLKWEKWLIGIFENLPRVARPEMVSLYMLPNAGELGQILKAHSHYIFTLGQAHGMVEIQKIIDKHERKLAEPEALTTFESMWVLPREALSVLEAKELVLAADVEAQVTTQVKKLLVDMMMGTTRKDVEVKIEELLKVNRNRASLITTTETTYAYNRGRLNSFHQSPGVDHVRFSAIMDKRTSVQCRTRHGLIMRLDDPELEKNTPPLHGHCRSILVPVLSRYQPIDESKLDWSEVAPLPKGWRAA